MRATCRERASPSRKFIKGGVWACRVFFLWLLLLIEVFLDTAKKPFLKIDQVDRTLLDLFHLLDGHPSLRVAWTLWVTHRDFIGRFVIADNHTRVCWHKVFAQINTACLGLTSVFPCLPIVDTSPFNCAIIDKAVVIMVREHCPNNRKTLIYVFFIVRNLISPLTSFIERFCEPT